MATVRLTNDMRSSIKSKAMKHRFGESDAEILQEEYNLAIKLYDIVYDKDVMKIIRQVPEGWLVQRSNFVFNAGGYRVDLKTEKSQPVKNEYWVTHNIVGLDLIEEVKKFSERREDYKDVKKSSESKLDAILNSVTTVGSLEKIWPEGKPFYKNLNVEYKSCGVPAIKIEELNSTFNLPVDKEEEENV